MADAESRQMHHVEVPVNLLEAAVLVAEVAPLAVGAELLAVELPTVLRLVLVVGTLLLLIEIELVRLAQLLLAVSILALEAVATRPEQSPVLAKLPLVH